MSKENKSALRRKDFLVVKQSTNSQIVKVVTPHTFQVGLDDPEFQKSLVVKGSFQLDKRFLDKTGSPYIKGSGSVTVTEDASGGVTISATLGTGATLTGGGPSKGITSFTYDGSSPATVGIDLDLNRGGLAFSTIGLQVKPSASNASLTSSTINSADLLSIEDVSDATPGVKKITVSDLMSAASSLTTLGNPLTLRDGLTNATYNNTSALTIDVEPASNGGLAISGGASSGGALKVDPSNAILTNLNASDSVLIYDTTSSDVRKTTAQEFADLASSHSLSSGTGLTYSVGSAYDGGANSTIAVDTSVIPTLSANNTFSGTNTFGAVIAKHDEVSAGVPYLVAGSNVSISYDTPSTGQITIASSLGGSSLTNGSGIATFTYDGSSTATVAIDATNLSSVAADRLDAIIVAEGGNLSNIRRASVGSVADIVDRTAIMAEGTGIDITFSGNANPAVISAQLDNDTLGTDGSGNIEVKKLPNALTNGPGIKSLSFDGSSALTVETNLIAGENITLTTNTGDNSITISSAAGKITGSISNITQADPGVVTTVSNHGVSEGMQVTITDVVGMTEVNGREYFADVLTSDTFALYEDLTLTSSVDTTGFTAYASNGIFVGEISGGQGAIDFVSGSTTVTSVDKVDVTNLAILNSYGSGDIALTGTIGTAEDGSYSDGLFTDFTTQTPVGTAVDRFNEVLKGLAPPAAPSLDDMDSSDTGAGAKLSFGNTQSITGYTNAQPSTLTPSSGLSNVDINGSYTSTETSNDLRIACFTGATVVDGTLNADVTADSPNYDTGAFGDGDKGTLKLFVNNNSTEKHSVDLSTFGSGASVNGNGSGFNLSAVTAGAFAGGSAFDTFKHRTGTYTVAVADQVDGWNYARVVHVVGSSESTCNYVEWVNDSVGSAVAMTIDNTAMDNLAMTGTKYLSGVNYHTGGTAQYRARVLNAFRNVFSTNDITYTGTNCSVPSQAFPTIDHSAGEDETKHLNLTGSATITADPLLNESFSVSTNVPAPLKPALSAAGSQSIPGILLYNLSDTATSTSEPFRGESYRRVSGSYDNQAAVTDSSAVWDSTFNLTGSDGMLFYNSTLLAPVQGGVSGDFRNTSDGGSIDNGPASNVNYSGITSGLRTFYRYFENTSGGSKTDFVLTIDGSGNIVQQTSSLSATDIHVLVKLPETGNGFTTGWMDLAKPFATDQTGDGAGCLNGALDSTLNANNTGTFGTQSVDAGEYIVVKIEADASWTGNISQMSIAWS